jgi:hypothetical protein
MRNGDTLSINIHGTAVRNEDGDLVLLPPTQQTVLMIPREFGEREDDQK